MLGEVFKWILIVANVIVWGTLGGAWIFFTVKRKLNSFKGRSKSKNNICNDDT